MAARAAELGATYRMLGAHAAPVDVVALLPIVAVAFAVPQFVPQIVKVRRTGDTAGLSSPWAILTAVNNAAWFGYFAASRYWMALIPSSTAALFGGCLGVMLARRAPVARPSRIAVGAWAGVLVLAALADRSLLGAALTAAFLVQVVPAVVTAYRTPDPTGIARGTWLLILGEVSCWAVFGAAHLDGPLLVLGASGVTSALLMLHRARPPALAPRP
jgi:PQ loop repeat